MIIFYIFERLILNFERKYYLQIRQRNKKKIKGLERNLK